MRVSDAIARLRYDLQDTNTTIKRWEDPLLLDYLNEGFRDLATTEIFQRYEIHIPTNGQLYFTPFCEVVSIKGIWYDWLRLAPYSPRQMDDLQDGLGDDWLTADSSNGGYAYIPGLRPRLWPRAGQAGTALTIGTVTVYEIDGLGPMGNGYWSAVDGTAKAHFLPGDGVVTDWTAANNLLIHYAYTPEPVGTHQEVDSRYLDAARYYAAMRALENSDDPLDVRFRAAAAASYERSRHTLAKWTARFHNGEHIPTFRRDRTDPHSSRVGQFPTLQNSILGSV